MNNNPSINEILSSPSVKLIEILDNNTNYAQVAILGEVELQKDKKVQFVLKLKKKEFDVKSILAIESIKSICTSPSRYFLNDIYQKYISQDLIQNKINVELIYPATPKVIDKCRAGKFEIITETYEIYKNKTLPYINTFDKNHIQWIHNILENKAEKILIQTEKFVILKNYTTVDNEEILDCLGLPYGADEIKSLRDLNEKHLDLLECFYTEGKKKLSEHFHCKPNEIRAFLHYPPSFYYLHVHFLHVSLDNFTACVNRAIDLGEIINNIKLKNDYYQTISIDHTVKVGSKLYEYLTK